MTPKGTIKAIDGFSLFDFQSTSTRFNQSGYQIGVYDDSPFTLQKLPQDDFSLRDYNNLAFRDGYHGPYATAAALSYLWSKGWTGEKVGDLRSTDPVVSQVMREIRGQSYTISGIPLSSMLYPIAVGFVLLLIAASMIGPMVRLGSENTDYGDEVWFMAISFNGYFAPILYAIQFSFFVGSILLPLWVGYDLAGVTPLVDPDKQLALWIAAFGGLAFAFAMLLFGYRLVRVGSTRSHPKPIKKSAEKAPADSA